MSDEKLKEDIHVPLALSQGVGLRAHAGRRVKKAPTSDEQFTAARDDLDPDAYDPLMGMPHPLDFDAD